VDPGCGVQVAKRCVDGNDLRLFLNNTAGLQDANQRLVRVADRAKNLLLPGEELPRLIARNDVFPSLRLVGACVIETGVEALKLDLMRSPLAYKSLLWTRKALSASHRQWLKQLSAMGTTIVGMDSANMKIAIISPSAAARLISAILSG
jgi:hypothetical protein